MKRKITITASNASNTHLQELPDSTQGILFAIGFRAVKQIPRAYAICCKGDILLATEDYRYFRIVGGAMEDNGQTFLSQCDPEYEDDWQYVAEELGLEYEMYEASIVEMLAALDLEM